MNLKQEEEKVVYSINRVDNYIIQPTKEELFQLNKNSYYHSNDRKCIICNIKFNHGQSNYKICNGCKIITQCPECMKINIIEVKDLRKNYFSFLLNCINKNELNKFYCFCNKKCMLSFRNKLPIMINASLKNLEKAEEYWKDHDRTEHFREYWKKHPDDWGKNLAKYREKNIEKVRENAIKNLIEFNKNKLFYIEKSLSDLNIAITKNSINILNNNLQNLRKNDICGAYLIRAKYKENNKIYDLLTCKSKFIYNEICWILRVLSQPKKQNKTISDSNPWTIAKWWYISNLYCNFEFVLLTDINGVSEEQALLIEAKYAIDNNLLIKFDENHIPQIEYEVHNGKHGYWNF